MNNLFHLQICEHFFPIIVYIFIDIKEKNVRNWLVIKKFLYLCTVRMSSEGANCMLSQHYSSWTVLTFNTRTLPNGMRQKYLVLPISSTSPTLMTQMFINRYKKVGGVNLVKALLAIPLLLLVCLVSSCSKDDEEQPKDYMTQLYEESQTLQYQTADSIVNFSSKFYDYLELNPDACNHPYYTAIEEVIYEWSPKCITVETDWDGEMHMDY